MGILNRAYKSLLALSVLAVTLLLALVLPLSSHAAFAQQQTVKVGVYDNYPKIYRDDNGNIKGFWADITDTIAAKENWKVDYVYGTFQQGLQRLQNGQIDMMVDVGVDTQRQQIYDFNTVNLLSGWAAVYA